MSFLAAFDVLKYMHNTQGLPLSDRYSSQVSWLVGQDPQFQQAYEKLKSAGPQAFKQVMLQSPVRDLVVQAQGACFAHPLSNLCQSSSIALHKALRGQPQKSLEYGYSSDYGGYDYGTPYQQYSFDNDYSSDYGGYDYSWGDTFARWEKKLPQWEQEARKVADTASNYAKKLGLQKGHSYSDYGYSADDGYSDYSLDGEYGYSSDYGGYDYSWDSFIHDVNRGMDKFADATAGWAKNIGSPAPPPQVDSRSQITLNQLKRPPPDPKTNWAAIEKQNAEFEAKWKAKHPPPQPAPPKKSGGRRT